MAIRGARIEEPVWMRYVGFCFGCSAPSRAAVFLVVDGFAAFSEPTTSSVARVGFLIPDFFWCRLPSRVPWWIGPFRFSRSGGDELVGGSRSRTAPLEQGRPSFRMRRITSFLFLGVAALVLPISFAWMFFSSFKTNKEIYQPTFFFLPITVGLLRGLVVGRILSFFDYFLHSILVSGGQAVLATHARPPGTLFQ